MAYKRKEDPAIDPFTRSIITWGFFIAVGLLFVIAVTQQFYAMQTGEKDEKTPGMFDDIKAEAESSRANETDPGALFDQGIAQARTGNPQEKIMGMQTIMSIDPNRAVAVVQGMLSDASPVVRAQAVRTLAQYKARGSGPVIARVLMDQDPNVRAAAASAMQEFGKEPGMMAFIDPALRSRTPAIATNACTAWMFVFPHDRNYGVRTISSALSSDNAEVAAAAVTSATSVMSTDELRAIIGDLQSIAARFPGTAAGTSAAAVVKKLN